MTEKIAQALNNLFEQHRIVYWNDADAQLREKFDALDLPTVEKLEIKNNEYRLKYHILREQPKQKFLLYRPGPQPADLENWLLDIQLAHGEFQADQASMWLSEFGFSPHHEFVALVKNHAEFYRDDTRKDKLKRLLRADDKPNAIRLKQLAICADTDSRFDAVLEKLLQELADTQDDKIKLIKQCGLDGFLWEQLFKHYGYESKEPSVRDFVITLFKHCYANDIEAHTHTRDEKTPHQKQPNKGVTPTDNKPQLNDDALVFLKRWQDSRQYGQCFNDLSAQCADVLGIEQDLSNRDYRQLIGSDYFELIERKIISELIEAVISRTIASGDAVLLIKQRRQSHWYETYKHHYAAIDFAVQFILTLNQANLSMTNFTDGAQRYSTSWFRIDQLYRKFIYHAGKASNPTLLNSLVRQIEQLYSNNYLLPLNDRWQVFVDQVAKWSDAPPINLQRHFYMNFVAPEVRKKSKVCVIISDAMRYEIGDELVSKICRLDRYSGSLEPALSMLPSYTQLGMAALLPNNELMIADNDSGAVIVDGLSSQGNINRNKILNQSLPGRAIALKCNELMSFGKDEISSLIKDNDVIYIYHNRIDSTGDKPESEARVFEAVEDTLSELTDLVKRLTPARTVLITSDHGFIYQNDEIEESDFSGGEAEGELIHLRNRRFVLGKGLKDHSSLRKFTSSELGLTGDVEVLIPKSINRLRRKGSGSRFVHGGASLQEVIVPVIKITKTQKNDTSKVEVEINRSSSSTITSGQLAVALYQTQAVKDKVQPRELRVGIYNKAGNLISDSHNILFDLTSENPREREVQLRFLLARQAEQSNGQEVVLKLEEKDEGSTHYTEYKSLFYQMRRSFTSDFDL
jgi:uncharacterized protein (TIGR02687 family)